MIEICQMGGTHNPEYSYMDQTTSCGRCGESMDYDDDFDIRNDDDNVIVIDEKDEY